MASSKISSWFVLFILICFYGCIPANVRTNTQVPSPEAVTVAPSPTATRSDPLPEATHTSTVQPTQTELPYCEQIAQKHRPPDHFKTYCDKEYKFAFNYPEDWEIFLVTQSPDSPNSSPLWVRLAQRFMAPDMSNFIRVDTYRLYSNMTLEERVQKFFSYPERDFAEKEYPTLSLAGHRAYAIINRWQQDVSAVYLFFQHGEHYSVIELKAPSHQALDLNWKIAHTIQAPGSTLDENVIPGELIEDSHHLLP